MLARVAAHAHLHQEVRLILLPNFSLVCSVFFMADWNPWLIVI